MYRLTGCEGVVFVWWMQAEGKVKDAVLLANGQTFVCPLLLDGVEHVCHQLLQAVRRCPSPVSPGVGVIEPHRPAVCCKKGEHHEIKDGQGGSLDGRIDG